MGAANSRQVGGRHYRSAYQHWDFAWRVYGAGYFKGQITKYVFRWRKKNGVEDLQKAAHFLQKYTEELRKWEEAHPIRYALRVLLYYAQPWRVERYLVELSKLIDENDIADLEAIVIIAVTNSVTSTQLKPASTALGRLLYRNLNSCTAQDYADATSAYVDQDPKQ